MKLLEYEAKKILLTSGIPVPAGVVIHTSGDRESVSAPVVLKSQVPTGKRGKAGGIAVIDDETEIVSAIDRLFNLTIYGYIPSTLLAEEKLAIANEFYLSIISNREQEKIEFIAHKEGGVEVESNAGSSFLRIDISPPSPNYDVIGQSLADYFELPEQTFALQDLSRKLHQCFVQNDATLIEINPLVLTESGQLIAGDCKMTLDDAAAFRHPEWNFEQKSKEVNFVSLDPTGTVATIANGAGLAMATVDAVADAGMRPANFLDVGGGANAESVLAAFRRIIEYPDVKAIVINIFAGITRCDEVAKAIIEARKQLVGLPPLCIRLAGTNYDQAKILLDNENISLLPTLKQCLDVAAQEASRG